MDISRGPFERCIGLPVVVDANETKASYQEGILEVVSPKENDKDIEEIPQQVKDKLEFILADSIDEVLGVIFSTGTVFAS